jgi:hypothetical protein
MTTVTFDTLKFVESLKKGDFSDKQAKAMSNALKEAQEARMEELATKADLQKEIAQAKVDIIKWVVGAALGTVGIIIGTFFTIIRIITPG